MTGRSLLAGADEHGFILRAELRSASETVVSYALDLTASSAFVATESTAPVGTQLRLRLSFPRLLEPVELDACIDELCASSGPGLPSGFRVRFDPDPGLSALLERAHGAASSQVAPRAQRMLLVEDNAFIRDVFAYGLGRFFEDRGTYTVDHAEDAELAWEKLAELDYDVVIVDYHLPAENGAALIERVRRDPRLAKIPIVAMSVGGRNARDASLAAGADLFLDKPLVVRDLFNTLRFLSPSAEPASTRKTILVFDDSPLILAVTRAALESAGFEVAIAEDLTTFERHRLACVPDLILVDVQMPEAFGDDVVLTLREWHDVRVPILLVSSLEEAELASRATRARAAGYISKRAGMTELVRRCKQVLGVGGISGG